MRSNADALRRRTLLLALAATAGCRSRGTGRRDGPVSPAVGVPRLRASADLVVRGGTILTPVASTPPAEALAVVDGVIADIGSEAELDSLIGPRTRVVDLAGGVAIAGLVDAHAHLVGLGQSLGQIDLRGATSIEDVVARLRAGAPPTGWIVGRGWDQNLWPGAEMPSHHPLTQAFPDQVVWLRRVDGHAGWGNAALLRESGISEASENPKGGEFLRDGTGSPTGVLVDAAMDSVRPPPPSGPEIERDILRAQQHAAALGLTGVHEMGIGATEDEAYRALASRSDPAASLQLRVHAYAAEGWFVRELVDSAPDPIRDDGVYTLAGVKLYADGALGSRGAALLADYADRSGHRGLMQHDQADLQRLATLALRGGWQLATHAIGDAANRAVLDAYQAALAFAARPDPRPRIEHCQVLSPTDIGRFASLGVIASMQPTHATSDMGWVAPRLGAARLPGAYAWRSLLDAGATLCFGSDFPVELADVTHGLYAATTRQDAQGQPAGGWLPEQRLTLDEALWAFTGAAAFACGREGHLGRLAPGFRADITCFARDLRILTPAELRSAKVNATIVEGRVLYQR